MWFACVICNSTISSLAKHLRRVGPTLQRDRVKFRLPEFIAANNPDANRYGVGKYGLRSLGAPLFVEGTMTLGETITRELWD